MKLSKPLTLSATTTQKAPGLPGALHCPFCRVGERRAVNSDSFLVDEVLELLKPPSVVFLGELVESLRLLGL